MAGATVQDCAAGIREGLGLVHCARVARRVISETMWLSASDAGLKLSNAMTPMKPALSASPDVDRPPEPGDGGDAGTQTKPPGESRPGVHIRWMGRMGRIFASVAPARGHLFPRLREGR